MAGHYEHLEKALCSELEQLDKKYMSGEDMTEQDLKRADMLYHALKSAATYHAMKEADGWGNQQSYRGGGRDNYAMRRGPYMSREMGEGYSGWYPMDYIDPYYRNRY